MVSPGVKKVLKVQESDSEVESGFGRMSSQTATSIVITTKFISYHWVFLSFVLAREVTRDFKFAALPCIIPLKDSPGRANVLSGFSQHSAGGAFRRAARRP